MVRFGRSSAYCGLLPRNGGNGFGSLQAGALSLAVLAGGCSADVGRFDFPGSGFADRGGTTGSLPTPRETVYRSPTGYLGAGTAPPADLPPVASNSDPSAGIYAPPRAQKPSGVQVAALPPAEASPSHSPPLARHSAPAGRPAAAKPAPSAAAPIATGEQIEVKRGDTLFAIARQHRVSLNELMKANGLSSPALKPGQKLVLPASERARKPLVKPAAVAAAHPTTPPPAGWGGTYTIKPGDSLYALALQHKVKLAELQQVNGIVDVRKVRPGTVLKVPGEASSSTASAASAAPAPASQPVTGAPPEPAQGIASSTQPTIINGPKVASLGEDKRTASDAPQPSAAPTPAVEHKHAQKVAAAAPAAVSSGKLRWPVKGKVLSGYGQRSDGTHNDGIDVAVPMGTDVHAADSGVVAYAGSELKAYGSLVLVRHDNGWVTAYAHNDQILVKHGDKVKRGQVLAKAGKSGQVDQPQVHFELRQGPKPVDPIPFLEKP